MTYEEAMAPDVIVTRAAALRELDRHGMGEDDRAEFFAEHGNRPTYSGAAVLTWLGY